MGFSRRRAAAREQGFGSPRLVFGVVLLAVLGYFAADPVLTFSWALGAANADDVAGAPKDFAAESRWVAGWIEEAGRRVTSSRTGLPVDQYLLRGPQGKTIALLVESPAPDRYSHQDEIYRGTQFRRTAVLARGSMRQNRFVADRIRTSAFLEWMLRAPPTEETLTRGMR